MKRARVRILLPALTAAFLAVTGCADKVAVVPGELQGTWLTGEARYANAFLRIDDTMIAFGSAEEPTARYLIVGIQSESSSSGTAYTIEYQTGDVVSRLGVVYEEENGAALRLSSRPSFSWRREKSG